MIEIVHVGLGHLGRKMVKSAVARGSFRIVGAVDVDPAKIGKDLGEFCGIKRLGVPISGNLDEAIRGPSPKVAEQNVTTGYKPIAKGMVRGVFQVGRGFIGKEEVITLTFRAAVGEPESYEQVQIEGDPSFTSRIAGGINGDIATCAVTLNVVRSILEVGPGLKTMIDLPAPSWFTATP